MTPAVKLVTLLVTALVAGTGEPRLLVLAALLTLAGWLMHDAGAFTQALGRLRRLRWLLLSIAVIYLWFTPGQPLVPALGSWSPTVEGLAQALRRAGVLCVIALAAWLVVSSTGRENMAAALLWLLRPLERVGVPCDRFAVRLSLTLDLVLNRPAVPETPVEAPHRGTLARASGLATERFRAAETAAAGAGEKGRTVAIPEAGSPPLVQWLVPVGVLGVAAAMLLLPVG